MNPRLLWSPSRRLLWQTCPSSRGGGLPTLPHQRQKIRNPWWENGPSAPALHPGNQWARILPLPNTENFGYSDNMQNLAGQNLTGSWYDAADATGHFGWYLINSLLIKYQPNPGYGNPPEALNSAYCLQWQVFGSKRGPYHTGLPVYSDTACIQWHSGYSDSFWF